MKQYIPGENSILLRGRLRLAPSLSHQSHQQQFYLLPMEVRRLSGAADQVNVLCPSPVLASLDGPEAGDRLSVLGEIRTYNNRSGTGPRLVISVLARSLLPTGEEDENRLHLSGTLCRPPALRVTPLGRTICDMTVAVGRRYGRADYLPCIAWGSVAHRCSQMTVGSPVSFDGRLQSRMYTKSLDTGTEERIAYEISVMDLTEPTEKGDP